MAKESFTLYSLNGNANVSEQKEFIHFYYIDTSVLLENIPLVKFIKTRSGTRVVYFS